MVGKRMTEMSIGAGLIGGFGAAVGALVYNHYGQDKHGISDDEAEECIKAMGRKDGDAAPSWKEAVQDVSNNTVCVNNAKGWDPYQMFVVGFIVFGFATYLIQRTMYAHNKMHRYEPIRKLAEVKSDQRKIREVSNNMDATEIASSRQNVDDILEAAGVARRAAPAARGGNAGM